MNASGFDYSSVNTGYYARASENGYRQKVSGCHAVDKVTNKPICGYKPHHTMQFHWCAGSYQSDYIRCVGCNGAIFKLAHNKRKCDLMESLRMPASKQDVAHAAVSFLGHIDPMGHKNSVYDGVNAFSLFKYYESEYTLNDVREWKYPGLFIPDNLFGKDKLRSYVTVVYWFSCGNIKYITLPTNKALMKKQFEPYEVKFGSEFGFKLHIDQWHSSVEQLGVRKSGPKRKVHFARPKVSS